MVYFATCVSRSMGPARGDSESASIHDKTMSVLAKAGYEVTILQPSSSNSLFEPLIYSQNPIPRTLAGYQVPLNPQPHPLNPQLSTSRASTSPAPRYTIPRRFPHQF